ncbi:hypothetical protein [Aquamicrobium sp. LC103]|uniref:hypothetical protein n=1 Tax=Aquamicrobium sp. LC103 TaxID=1120658 RepID=UPI000B23DA10|nr:hypothetical protein [Aquamicrobium sp. LC103]TKT82688.1 hypothetical protein XW59_001630 [Aquamicrobium sp. LC103]
MSVAHTLPRGRSSRSLLTWLRSRFAWKRRAPRLDLRSMPDYLKRDMGLHENKLLAFEIEREDASPRIIELAGRSL